MPRRKRKHRGGIPREIAPFVTNRYGMRRVRWVFQCEHKRRYPDRRTAMRDCQEIFEASGDRMHPYKCRCGGHYHIGHSRRRHIVYRRDVMEEELGE